jgi:hypothetical protein
MGGDRTGSFWALKLADLSLQQCDAGLRVLLSVAIVSEDAIFGPGGTPQPLQDGGVGGGGVPRAPPLAILTLSLRDGPRCTPPHSPPVCLEEIASFQSVGERVLS